MGSHDIDFIVLYNWFTSQHPLWFNNQMHIFSMNGGDIVLNFYHIPIHS